MENHLVGILHIFKITFIFVGMLMLTVVEKKLNFTLSVLYVATTSYFVENGIKAKYERNKDQVLGSKLDQKIEINTIKKSQTGLSGVIDGGMLKFINFEF